MEEQNIGNGTGAGEFERREMETGLHDLKNWIGDVRPLLAAMLEPLLEGTGYSFRVNTTDKSGKRLELWHTEYPGRVMGFKGKRNGEI